MKNVIVQVLALVLSASAYAQESPFPAPALVKVAAETIFTPPGFDDNDNIQIVAFGQLINTCYKTATPDVAVDHAKKLITVSAQAYVYSSAWCLQVLVPFTQTIDLGLLPMGQYRVVEYDVDGTLLHDVALPVARSGTSAPDSLLYAPVEHAKLDLGAEGSAKTLVMSGTFSSECMEMQEVKVLHRVPNIIEVLPVAAYKTGSSCKPSPKAFEVSVKLPATTPGNTLVYVRSLNGQAISLVYPF